MLEINFLMNSNPVLNSTKTALNIAFKNPEFYSTRINKLVSHLQKRINSKSFYFDQ